MFRQPLAKGRCRGILFQYLGLFDHLGGDPVREGDLLHDVVPSLGVDLSNRGQPLFRKPVGKSHQGGPEATMHKRHLASNEPAYVDEM